MRQGRAKFLGFVAAALVLLWAAPPVQADKHKPADKVKAEVLHLDGHTAQKVFDLKNPDDKAELEKLVGEGRVLHLVPEEPVNLMALAWDLGLWTIVVFGLLLLILRKAAWGPMLEGLRKREQTIRAAVDEAKLARAETLRVTAEFQAEMQRKMAEIPKIMEEARRDADNLITEMRTKATAEIQTERQRLRREVEMARDQALQQIWNEAAQLATLISAKAIRRSLSLDDHRRLVDEALTELRETGQQHRRQAEPLET
jgi:F-type H+-transporting ATPase subunit b